jgi:RNA polymerase sigma-70 factor (ECF subfamily)
MPRLFLVDDLDPGQLHVPEGGAVNLPSPEPGAPGPSEASPRPVQLANGADRERRLRSLVDRYLDFVARVLRNAGTPEADVEDEVQRTFIIAARRIDDVRPGSEKSFLLQTALHLAAHARRTIARRREVGADRAPERLDLGGTPEQLTHQKRVRELLDQVLGRMTDDLRTVFVLFELEEMSTAEIAEALGIPAGTVASRLRRARADFRARVGMMDGLSRVGRAR